MKKNTDDMEEEKKPAESIQLMGMGLITAMFFYLLGTFINKAVPSVHTYAWMIILVAVSKALGIVPKKIEYAAQQWSQFVMGNWTNALLVGIGISMIDLGAGIGGHLVGFYPIESAITAGLCTTNMGGVQEISQFFLLQNAWNFFHLHRLPPESVVL